MGPGGGLVIDTGNGGEGDASASDVLVLDGVACALELLAALGSKTALTHAVIRALLDRYIELLPDLVAGETTAGATCDGPDEAAVVLNITVQCCEKFGPDLLEDLSTVCQCGGGACSCPFQYSGVCQYCPPLVQTLVFARVMIATGQEENIEMSLSLLDTLLSGEHSLCLWHGAFGFLCLSACVTPLPIPPDPACPQKRRHRHPTLGPCCCAKPG